MATNVNVSSEFKGVLAGQLLAQAFKKSDTISKGAITVLPGIIASGYLPKLDYTGSLAPFACGFTPTGTIDYSDKEIATKKYELKHEICKEDFRQTFQAQELGLYSASAEIPATIADAILESIVNNLGAIVDREIWQGTGVTGSFAGLLAQFTADTDVVDVVGTASTVANVQAELGKVYQAIPSEILNDDIVFIISNNIMRNYKQSQIANYLVGTPVGDKTLNYLGYDLISIDGLPNNTMVAYRKSNLGFLTGAENEINEVRVIDLDAVDGSDLVRTKVVFNAGVGYSRGEEIVYYKA